jgi:2Fe-2S ferredoxin
VSDHCKLRVRGHDQEYVLALGQSILDASEEQGIGLDHACGGVCACSTCHVKVKQGMECLTEADDDELDQLDTARDLALDSRLGCQAKLAKLPGSGVIEIEIPEWNVNAVQEGH